MTIIKQGEGESSQNNLVDPRKPSSKFDGVNRNPSLEQQGEEHISLPSKIDERIPTTTGTGKDRATPQYSTREVKITPKKMSEE